MLPIWCCLTSPGLPAAHSTKRWPRLTPSSYPVIRRFGAITGGPPQLGLVCPPQSNRPLHQRPQSAAKGERHELVRPMTTLYLTKTYPLHLYLSAFAQQYWSVPLPFSYHQLVAHRADAAWGRAGRRYILMGFRAFDLGC